MQRRLAEILVTDVVGYSRLMGADEAGTLERLQAARRTEIGPLFTKHGGRIIKLTGDGAIVEFASVVEAVRCAVLVQEAMARRNAGLPEARRISLRIAIHLGDIMADENDVYGDGVNVAARLEALATPGGIVVSETVREHVADKLDIAFADLGPQSLKNIARPVRVHRVTSGSAVEHAAASPSKPSVAVLPFVNMSGDAEQEYFSDGMSEDLITDLSKVSGLFVLARNSTFAFKGTSVDVRELGRRLNVRYVLEGSVRKAGACRAPGLGGPADHRCPRPTGSTCGAGSSSTATTSGPTGWRDVCSSAPARSTRSSPAPWRRSPTATPSSISTRSRASRRPTSCPSVRAPWRCSPTCRRRTPRAGWRSTCTDVSPKPSNIYRSLDRPADSRAAATEALRRAERELELELHPDNAPAAHLGATVLVTLGETQRAREWVSRALAIEPDDFLVLYNVACAYAQLGELDAGVDVLERALPSAFEETKNWLRLDSDLDPLREHPRFQALLARLAIAP